MLDAIKETEESHILKGHKMAPGEQLDGTSHAKLRLSICSLHILAYTGGWQVCPIKCEWPCTGGPQACRPGGEWPLAGDWQVCCPDGKGSCSGGWQVCRPGDVWPSMGSQQVCRRDDGWPCAGSRPPCHPVGMSTCSRRKLSKLTNLLTFQPWIL